MENGITPSGHAESKICSSYLCAVPKRLKRFLQNEVADYCQAHPDARPFTLHDFRGTAMSTAKMAGVSYDEAAITFGCHPETMRRHYIVINEVAISDGVLERVQRVKQLEKSVEDGSKSVEGSTDQGET